MGSTELGVFDARFELSLWLPISAVAFALVSLFPLVSRRVHGQPIALSWIGIARAIGCFGGLWVSGFAIWLFARAEALSMVWVFGILGFLLALPWRMITRASIWWVLFTVLAAFTLVPFLALSWLFIALVFSTPQPPGSILWMTGGVLSVTFLAVQAFAVWRLRRRKLSCPGEAVIVA